MQMQKEYPAESVEEKVVAVLKTCYDPEIPVDIYELGLIYGVSADEADKVHVTMTLTSPACPVARHPARRRCSRRSRRGSTKPPPPRSRSSGILPGTTDMMSDAAKLELGMF